MYTSNLENNMRKLFGLALLVGMLALATSVVAASSHTTTIWTTHGDGTRIGTIDATTGAGTDVGATGVSQTWAAAFDIDGTLYTLTRGFSGNARLATVDQTTGVVTEIGGTGTDMISLEIAADGTMYGVGSFDRILYTIDKSSGATTAIGSTGIAFVMDLAFDSAGTLYATVDNRLWTLDTSTGASTFVTVISGVPDGAIMGIMFDSSDTLYATVYRPNSPLLTVDTSTGAATVVGATGMNLPHGGDMPACETKACILADSGVDGNGISKAPGLQKEFNSKSMAAEKAGKKK
jgi:hypothetical protein